MASAEAGAHTAVCPGSNHFVGLFGSVEGGRILNTRLRNISISGSGNLVGGLAGRNSGEISNSYAKGDVSGDGRVGGLAGHNDDGKTIATSYASGRVTGNFYAGGLIGYNSGAIHSSYWNVETTLQNSGIGSGNQDGVTGLTTFQMTGVSAYDHMSALDFQNTWLLTEGYPALYWENVKAIDLPTAAQDNGHPVAFELRQNYPNPFNPVTQISYAVAEPGHIRLEVYNVLGQRMAVLVDEHKAPGRYQATFHAANLSSGVYLCRIHTESYTETRQMVLAR